MSATMNTKETDTFAWVDVMVEERDRLNMSPADLARASELTRATISDYEQRRRANPDIKALVKISKALGHSPLWLPRIAKLIPPDIETDQAVEDILHALDGLTPTEKQEILSYINFRKNQHRNP